MLIPKKNIIRSEKHRRFVASLPCATTGIIRQSQAAHIRHGCYSAGMKPCDSLCVPLSWSEHLKQHEVGEEKFWEIYGGIEKAKELAKKLYENTGNTEKCKKIIKNFRISVDADI